MEKVLPLNSPKEHYVAPACIVWCFDARYSGLYDTFVKHRNFEFPDPVKVAGGAQALASDGGPARDFVLDQIRKSIALHKTPKVILMVHRDCGAYGGSAKFNNDREAEIAHHSKELQKAAEYLGRALNNISVEAYIADFDGLYEVVVEEVAA